VLQARPSPTKLVAGRGSGGHRCGRAAGDEVGRGVGQDRRIIARQVAAHGIDRGARLRSWLLVFGGRSDNLDQTSTLSTKFGRAPQTLSSLPTSKLNRRHR
jgi:hypothetical protein